MNPNIPDDQMLQDFLREVPGGNQKPARSAEAEEAARAHWNTIAKPLHSLGRLEDILVQIAGIRGNADVRLDRRRVFVFCADNGITDEGVTQCGREVTAKVAENIGKGGGNICAIAGEARCDVFPADVGIADTRDFPGVLKRKAAEGTRDFLKEPAMSGEEALFAVRTGFELTECSVREGYDILAAGEMGIGNTTTSAAVTAALLHLPSEQLTGRGAGLDDAGLLRKRKVIEEGIAKYKLEQADAFGVLCAVGGFDLAATAGLFIGGAVRHIPVVMDGCISAAAALIAERLLPGTKDFLIPSHLSREPIATAVFRELGMHAVIDADLALGEGTGAVMMLHLLDSALAVYRTGSSFSGIGMEAYREFETGEKKC